MTGRRQHHGLVLQPRDRELLRLAGQLRVLSRDDAQALAGFQSVTRANARLLQLSSGGLLTRLPYGTRLGGQRYLYALSSAGARAIDVPTRPPLWSAHGTIAWSPTLEHQLLLNRVYRDLRAWVDADAISCRLLSWRTFDQPLSPVARVIPDAYIQLSVPTGNRSVFVEVDRGTETRAVWARKVRAYLLLAQSGEFARLFQQPQFRVAVVLPSTRRLHSIRRVIARQTSKLFWLIAVDRLTTSSLLTSPWLRPIGDGPQPLIEL